MKCKKVQKYLLSQADGHVHGTLSTSIASHLEDCLMCRQQYQAMSQIFTGAEQWHRLAPDQNMWYAIAKEIQPENKKHYRWQEIFDQILLPKPAWSITFCLIFGFIFGLFITGELSRISQQKPNMAINSTSQQSTPEDTFYTSSPVFSTQALYASFAGLEIK